MGKAPLILQYLHDHARLICDRRNLEDGQGTWRITPVSDEMRRNIIFHYGTIEHYDDFFKETPKLQHKKGFNREEDPLIDKEIDLRVIERRNLMKSVVRRKPLPRLSIPRKVGNEGIFSKCIQGLGVEIADSPLSRDQEQGKVLRELDAKEQQPLVQSVTLSCQSDEDSDRYKRVSSSQIILKQHNSVQNSSDYENDLFNEPEDMELAHFHHQRGINNSKQSNCNQQPFSYFDQLQAEYEFAPDPSPSSLNCPIDYNNFPLNSYENSNDSFYNSRNDNFSDYNMNIMYNNPVFNASCWNESNFTYTEQTNNNHNYCNKRKQNHHSYCNTTNTSNNNKSNTNLKFNSQPNDHYFYY